MIQIVYVSKLVAPYSDELMDSMLNKARKNNQEKDITGMLLFKNGFFIQLIEGPGPKVMELFEKIKADSRHSQIKVLVSQRTEERIFKDWTMGFKELSADELEKMDGSIPWQELLDLGLGLKVDSNTILNVLKKFRYKF